MHVYKDNFDCEIVTVDRRGRKTFFPLLLVCSLEAEGKGKKTVITRKRLFNVRTQKKLSSFSFLSPRICMVRMIRSNRRKTSSRKFRAENNKKYFWTTQYIFTLLCHPLKKCHCGFWHPGSVCNRPGLSRLGVDLNLAKSSQLEFVAKFTTQVDLKQTFKGGVESTPKNRERERSLLNLYGTRTYTRITHGMKNLPQPEGRVGSNHYTREKQTVCLNHPVNFISALMNFVDNSKVTLQRPNTEKYVAIFFSFPQTLHGSHKPIQ